MSNKPSFIFRERKEKIPFIKQNIHESIYDILNNMNKINPPVDIENIGCKNSVEYILRLGPKDHCEYTDVSIIPLS